MKKDLKAKCLNRHRENNTVVFNFYLGRYLKIQFTTSLPRQIGKILK
ncbi:MAG: hypothetical protein JST15_14295 [Bacteroidetes bacterium]|nr:hypothetical protein [Bacteroidota bacterium]